MTAPEVVTHAVTAPEGHQLCVYEIPSPHPPLLLAGGLGGPFASWHYQLEYLGERYRVLSWDYRGLYGSELPASGQLEIEAQVDDLLAVLDQRGVQRAACVGWSMGAQVLLALCQRAPERVSHLVLVNPTFGRPFDSITLPFAARLLPKVTERMGARSSRWIQRASTWPETVLWLRRLGLVGNTIDQDLFQDLAAQLAACDMDVLLATLKALGKHDASEGLQQLDVPALVIAGERDRLASKQVAQQMARRIPNAEMLVVRGSTHYTPLEYPELVNLRIEKFLREHHYGQSATSPLLSADASPRTG